MSGKTFGVDTGLLKLLLGGIGVYVVYRLVTGTVNKAGAAVSTGYSAAVNWTSELLSSWFGPSMSGSSVYHLVTFVDDGSRHAVGAGSVDSNGQFQWTGFPPGSQAPVTYQLGQDGSGNWVASPV